MTVCVGVGTTPCPHGKTATRGLRCPDCTLAHRQGEDRKRMARITKATPPAHTFDGQLQRMRDRNRAAEAGQDLDDVEAEEEENDERDEDVDAVDQCEDPPADLVHPPAPVTTKPEHRQAPKPKDRVTGELPWWATRGRDGFTEAATAKRDEMTAEARRRGITVEGKVDS